MSDRINYLLRKIRPQGLETTTLVCQNENGPCPLLAIANLLLLQGKITIHPDLAQISLDSLSDLLGDYLIAQVGKSKTPNDPNLQQNLSDAIASFPKLATGLDVNVGFQRCDHYEYTEKMVIFDLVGIRLLHGWMIAEDDTQTQDLVGSSTYNQMVQSIAEYRSNDENDSAVAAKAEALSNFLDESASQLTVAGIARLKETLPEGAYAVFFRNNHFTVLSHREAELYHLITDVGYKITDVVWETLTTVTGKESRFVDASFQPVNLAMQTSEARDRQMALELAGPGVSTADRDMDQAIAMSLNSNAAANVTAPVDRQPSTSQAELDEAIARSLADQQGTAAAVSTASSSCSLPAMARLHLGADETVDECSPDFADFGDQARKAAIGEARSTSAQAEADRAVALALQPEMSEGAGAGSNMSSQTQEELDHQMALAMSMADGNQPHPPEARRVGTTVQAAGRNGSGFQRQRANEEQKQCTVQ